MLVCTSGLWISPPPAWNYTFWGLRCILDSASTQPGTRTGYLEGRKWTPVRVLDSQCAVCLLSSPCTDLVDSLQSWSYGHRSPAGALLGATEALATSAKPPVHCV